MRSRFDWETDEVSRARAPAPPKVPVDPRRRFWPILLLLMLIVALAVAIAYRLANQRLNDTTRAMEAEVLRVHELLYQADEQEDPELLDLLVQSPSSSWASQLESNLLAGSLVDRRPFGLLKAETPPSMGLPWESSGAIGDTIEVSLSPNLDAADLRFVQAYEISSGGWLDGSVRLEQVLHFERKARRWLLAPPEEGFWGVRLWASRSSLNLSYPMRDEDIALRLASDLNHLVEEACGFYSRAACPSDLNLAVELVGDLESLGRMDDLEWFTKRAGRPLRLPTPTLVGLPTDDKGYEVLLRGYAIPITTAVATRLLDYACCRHGLFFQAILAKQWHQGGIRPWPMTKQQFETLAKTRIHLKNVSQSWRVERVPGVSEVAIEVYAFIAFLVERSGGDISRLGPILEAGEGETLLPMIGDLMSGHVEGIRELEDEWFDYIRGAAGDQYAAANVTPHQPLMLGCKDGATNAGLYVYRPDVDSFSLELRLDAEDVFLLAMPDDTAIIVGELSQTADSRLFLRQGEQTALLSTGQDDYLPISFSGADTERLLLFNRRTSRHEMMQLGLCLAGGSCRTQSLFGVPVWAPAGEQFLTLPSIGLYGSEGRFERPFTLGGTTGKILGPGKSPVWLDDINIAYVERADNIVTYSISSAETDVILTLEELVTELSGSIGPSQIRAEIDHIALDSADSAFLLVSVLVDLGRDDTQIALFRYGISDKSVRLVTTVGAVESAGVTYDYGSSPDGRWIVITGWHAPDFSSTIIFLDSIGGAVRRYELPMSPALPMPWIMDWSADGKWLSVIDNGYLRMIAPDADRQEVYIPEALSCSSAVWISAQS